MPNTKPNMAAVAGVIFKDLTLLKVQKGDTHFQKIPLVFYVQARTFAADFSWR